MSWCEIHLIYHYSDYMYTYTVTGSDRHPAVHDECPTHGVDHLQTLQGHQDGEPDGQNSLGAE